MRSLLLAFLLLAGTADAGGPSLSADRLTGVWVQARLGLDSGPDRICFVFRADSSFTLVMGNRRAKPSVARLDGAFKIEAEGVRLTDKSGEFDMVWPSRFESDTLVLVLQSGIHDEPEGLRLDRVVFPPLWCSTFGKTGG